MARTPGLVVPSSYSSEEELKKDIDRRSAAAGFTPLEFPSTEAIEHFGVKGMHWGVRRAQSIVNSPGGRQAQRLGGQSLGAVKDLRTGRTPTKLEFNKKVQTAGGLHKISDAELKRMLNRLDNEKKYTKMLTEDADKRAEGRKTAVKVLHEVGKLAVPIVIAGFAGGFAAKAADRGVFRTTAFPARTAINIAKKAIGA